jgi:Protein of unknown function (DUF1749)
MGSSTGANDVMWYVTRGNETERVARYPLDGVILQGPVSDQDNINWYAEDQGTVASLKQGQKLAEGVDYGKCVSLLAPLIIWY